ncbi:MAG: aminodeoxychorismate synthase component I [Candidatus Thiodiazotropha sp.]
MSLRLQALPYTPDSSVLFEALRHMPWPVFLDSGYPVSQQGRYDILAADPSQCLITRGHITEVQRRDHRYTTSADPLDLLRQALAPGMLDVSDELPFHGGAIGYLGYDLARAWLPLKQSVNHAGAMPDMAMGIYDWAIVVDHHDRSNWLVCGGQDPRSEQILPDLLTALSRCNETALATPETPSAEIVRHLTRQEYGERFQQIQRYIREGDCYQVNFAQRFSLRTQMEPWGLYRRLRQANPAPFSAYLEYPMGSVLSSSPERFLRLQGDRVETCPIKGTRPRSTDPLADLELLRELSESPKDRAENVMIVDLLRNDLGRVCRVGSIEVPDLFQTESYAAVHHLVSRVTGTLAEESDGLDLLRACLPGGSITGTPKLRAMQIIDELEDSPRGVYCGSIAYFDRTGVMDSNIAIRTLCMQNGQVDFRVGGGIVADSDESREYQETLDKAEAIFRALGRYPRKEIGVEGAG